MKISMEYTFASKQLFSVHSFRTQIMYLMNWQVCCSSCKNVTLDSAHSHSHRHIYTHSLSSYTHSQVIHSLMHSFAMHSLTIHSLMHSLVIHSLTHFLIHTHIQTYNPSHIFIYTHNHIYALMHTRKPGFSASTFITFISVTLNTNEKENNFITHES